MGHFCYDSIIATATTSEWRAIEAILKSGAIKLTENELSTIGHGRITCENKYRSGINEEALLCLSRLFPCSVFCWKSEMEDYPPQIHYYVSGKVCTLHTALRTREKAVRSESRRFLKKALQIDDAFPFLNRFETSIQDILKINPAFQPKPLDMPPVKQISCGDFHASALTDDGRIISWGLLPFSQKSPISFNQMPVQISCGRYHTAVLFVDGTVQVLGTLCSFPKEINTPNGSRNPTPKYPLYLELVYSDAYNRIENCKRVSIGDELILKKVTSLNEVEVFTTTGLSLGLLKNTKAFLAKSLIPDIKKLKAFVHEKSKTARKETSGITICIKHKDEQPSIPVTIQKSSQWKSIIRIHSLFDGVIGIDSRGQFFQDGFCGEININDMKAVLWKQN